MEQLIRHVRFFNGQFLKQDEFNEEQSYANHMRRRVNYALFENGVVQVTAADLTIAKEAPGDASNKRIRILPGLAIGAHRDLFESREVILRDASSVVNLSDSFSAASTVWVTVNYLSTEGAPVAVGSTTENSRVDESAQIQFHTSNPAGTFTAAGDPFIVLGAVTLSSMNVSTSDRQIARLRSALLTVAPSLAINPVSATIGTLVTMTLTSNAGGGPDLSSLTAANVAARVTFGGTVVTGLTVIGTPTATSATIRFTVDNTTTAGTRNVTVTIGAVSASAPFAVSVAVAAPTISTLPVSGTRNNPITITGSGFTGTVTVAFPGGATATPTSINAAATSLTVTVPGTAAGTATVTITAAGGSVTSTGTITIF